MKIVKSNNCMWFGHYLSQKVICICPTLLWMLLNFQCIYLVSPYALLFLRFRWHTHRQWSHYLMMGHLFWHTLLNGLWPLCAYEVRDDNNLHIPGSDFATHVQRRSACCLLLTQRACLPTSLLILCILCFTWYSAAFWRNKRWLGYPLQCLHSLLASHVIAVMCVVPTNWHC